jgi:hypothetical protein
MWPTTLLLVKRPRTVLVTALITIQAVFAVVILGTVLTEADITDWATGNSQQ